MSIYIYTYVYIYICIFTYTGIHIYIYIHTYGPEALLKEASFHKIFRALQALCLPDHLELAGPLAFRGRLLSPRPSLDL